ncbi:MAG TPA: CotH kinase family protein [Ruminococcus flavefaciens]|nr:CotH kinase family protein [Ruminococcus flavefaciens]HQM01558.1 CotH kinase family protein [Ruminococcus flavefaciens]
MGKAVHVDMFEGDGSLGFSQDMGVRIFGASSRANLQKSLKLIARKKYGSGKVDYELIPDAETSDGDTLGKYDSFILRCGANDASWTKLRDPVLQELVRDRDFETQCGRPAIAFLNGEYWGLYQITEDYSDNYIHNRYGYGKDNTVIIKNGDLEDGLQSDFDDYKELVKFVRNNDMSVRENYEKLGEMIDLQSMADYHASQIYINNQDVYGDAWMNNTRMWKLRTPEDDAQGDGRWRYMLYDTEYSTYLYGRGGDFDALKNAMFENSDSVIFSKTLRQNKEFRELFLNTVMDLANLNYTKENTDKVIDNYYELYSPLMEEHVKRFGPEWRVRNLYNGFYTNQINTFRNFFDGRREKLAKALISYGLGRSTSELTVTVNNNEWGTVTINTIAPEISSTGWKGLYFNDCELVITAIPYDGYEFDGWSGLANGRRKTVRVKLSEASSIKAKFKKK